MSQGFLLIDGSNIAHAANSAKVEMRCGEQVTTAIFGFLRSIRPQVAMFPQLMPIVLWDGRSWRKQVFKPYKAGRDDAPKSKQEEIQLQNRATLKTQLPHIKRGLSLLGMTQIDALNMEADDLAGMLVKRHQPKGKKIMLLSGDKDWIQLVSPGVGWFDPIRNWRLTHGTLSKRLGWCPDKKRITCFPKDQGDKFMGVPSPRAWLEMKALMGDSSDEIPGVGGIGEKGALELVVKHTSVGGFLSACIDGTIKDLPKKLADFVDSDEKQEIYRRNLLLMDLNHPHIPKPIDLRVNKTELDPDAFYGFCEEFLFNSILTSEDWHQPFERIAA
jgi:5'-3' exonuclease